MFLKVCNLRLLKVGNLRLLYLHNLILLKVRILRPLKAGEGGGGEQFPIHSFKLNPTFSRPKKWHWFLSETPTKTSYEKKLPSVNL